MELWSKEYCPTRRGWTFCPARERPFWIIREACPLHALEEVRNAEGKCEENKKKKKRPAPAPASATATA
jgi:hypothetical protein